MCAINLLISTTLIICLFYFQAKTLDNRVQALQDDLFAAQDELQAVQEKYEEVCTYGTYKNLS